MTLNLILLAAVAFLYFKVYSDDNPRAYSGSSEGLRHDAIVFVNSDSLLDKYDYFNTLKSNFERKQDSIDNFLKEKGKILENEVVAYQKKAESMSPQQRAGEEEKLMQKQQQIMDLKQSLLDELNDEESRMNDNIHDHLTGFLRKYNKDKNYLYILGYQRGSGILLANDSLDITSEIIKGINESKE